MINHSNKKDELRHARDTGHNRDYYYEKIKKKQKLIFFRVKLNIHRRHQRPSWRRYIDRKPSQITHIYDFTNLYYILLILISYNQNNS